MKNLLLPFLAIALISTSCSKDEVASTLVPTAPIITGADGTKNFPSTGTLSRSTFRAGSIPGVVAAGSNMTFNYGNIAVTADGSIVGANLANSSFAGATSTISAATNFFGSTLSTPLVDYFTANATSLLFLGTRYNAIDIPFPGVGSVSFPLQNVILSTPHKLAEFPMKFNDASTQNFTATVNFTVTSPALPMPNVQARYIDSETVTSTNLSWGTLRIPGYAAPMQTLVQKVTERTVRNYFLMNATGGFGPMPAALLQAVQLVDGAVTTFTYHRYWVAGKGFVMLSDADGGGIIFNGL